MNRTDRWRIGCVLLRHPSAQGCLRLRGRDVFGVFSAPQAFAELAEALPWTGRAVPARVRAFRGRQLRAVASFVDGRLGSKRRTV